MVKHIILWTLKPEHNTPEIKQGMKQGLEALVGVVPGLLEMRIETQPLASSNADVMLYSVLESADALKGYAVHPAHVEVANTLVRPYTATRACMDFEVE
jgi:hypothetical protein